MKPNNEQIKVTYYEKPRKQGNSLGINIPSTIHKSGLVTERQVYKVTLEPVATRQSEQKQ